MQRRKKAATTEVKTPDLFIMREQLGENVGVPDAYRKDDLRDGEVYAEYTFNRWVKSIITKSVDEV